MATVSTSLVVSFRGDSATSEGRITAEIDGRPNGLNAGKTSFVPGDSVGILVYLGQDVSFGGIIASAGVVASAGGASVDKEDFVSFAKVKEANLSAFPSGNPAVTWLGAAPASYSISNGIITVPEEIVAMAHVTYTAKALAFRLTSVPPPSAYGLEEMQVVVYIYGDDGT